MDEQLGPRVRLLTGHDRPIRSVSILAGGGRALSGSEDNTIRLWDLATGAELLRIAGHTRMVMSVAMLPDGERALSGSFDRTMRLWDLRTGAELRRFDHPDFVEAVAALRDGRWAITGCGDHSMRLWDVETGAELRRFPGHTETVSSVAAHPDGRRALSGSHDHTVRLWDLETGGELRRFERHEAGVNAVAALPDGKGALSGSADRSMRLWDLETGAELRRFDVGDMVYSVATFPDGRRALSGSEDRIVRLWDLETGAELRRFEGHSGAVWSVAVLPGGKGALSGAFDNTLRLWDIPEPATPIDPGFMVGPPSPYEQALAWVKAFRRDRGDLGGGPSCFLSYAWGDPQHAQWVEHLAEHLEDADISVILDRWNPPGTSVSRFIERIDGSDYVCPVGTPGYKLKDQTQDADPVVHAELLLIKSKLRMRDDVRRTVIPLLLEGTQQQVFPPLLQDSFFVDFRQKTEFFSRLFDLVLTIHGIPFADKTARQHRAALRGATDP